MGLVDALAETFLLTNFIFDNILLSVQMILAITTCRLSKVTVVDIASYRFDAQVFTFFHKFCTLCGFFSPSLFLFVFVNKSEFSKQMSTQPLLFTNKWSERKSGKELEKSIDRRSRLNLFELHK